MTCLITGGGGGGLSKYSKTDDGANPTNYMFSFILVKPVACLYNVYTFYLVEHDLIFRTGFLATVESHCIVPFDILKVYTCTFQNTVDI